MRKRKKNAQLAREQVAPVVSSSSIHMHRVCVCIYCREEKANVNTVCFAVVFAYFLGGRLPTAFCLSLATRAPPLLVPLSDPPIQTAECCVRAFLFLPFALMFFLPFSFFLLTSQQQQEVEAVAYL